MLEIPLLEPGNFQEAKDMIKWAFELSEEIRNVVMVRSVTRLSHASGNVIFDHLPQIERKAFFKCDGPALDPMEGPLFSMPVTIKHTRQQEKLPQAVAKFEESAFNTYTGPESPELLIISSSACHLYSKEAIHILGIDDRVGLLKMGTTWPLPPNFMQKHLSLTDNFLEENVKILSAELASQIGAKTFFGKKDGSIPTVGEMNPDLVIAALCKILKIENNGVPEIYTNRAQELFSAGAPHRDMTFCAGCPHRASFWSIHNILKTLHSMGSGMGIASGFGKLGAFGFDQPVLAVCGDSTFYHAVLPALVNAVHHQSDITLVVLDNSGTAMTGFQPHPGLPVDAAGNKVPAIDVTRLAQSMGAHVQVCDPFDLQSTQKTLLELLEQKGVNILVLKQICALSPEPTCIGENCGCNQLCTRIFKCPGLIWNKEKKVSHIDEVICTGCGVCASICPSAAIRKKEVA
jgi:indolepyruvate ferredoxin oxidoreductase alpha subunit